MFRGLPTHRFPLSFLLQVPGSTTASVVVIGALADDMLEKTAARGTRRNTRGLQLVEAYGSERRVWSPEPREHLAQAIDGLANNDRLA